MFERVLALLLRLYPPAFRERYLREALLLCRDRGLDERGIYHRARLCCDLLVDLASGLPQAYRNRYTTTTQARQTVTGLPAFRTLEEEPLRPGSVVSGGVLGSATLALFVLLMSHATGYQPLSWPAERAGAASARGRSSAGSVEERLAQIRSASLLQQCSFDRLERHPGNIGYVKLAWFADPASCRGVAEAVMQDLSDTDAVIFDLRETRGGFPEMVRFMAGWLFDHPVAWYNPRAESSAQRVTDSPVQGSRLANKPVFILTSSHTLSGAEHFAYNLKTLKRATIVGEATSGASHAGMAPPPARTAHSQPKPIWEGSGVLPDVRVDAADALRTAEELSLAAMRRE